MSLVIIGMQIKIQFSFIEISEWENSVGEGTQGRNTVRSDEQLIPHARRIVLTIKSCTQREKYP